MTSLTTPTGTQTAALIDRLADSERGEWVTAATIDDFLAAPGLVLVLFTGDPAQRPEAGDVAVIVRELLRLGGSRVRAGIIVRSDEDQLKSRFGAVVMPNLVFLKEGRILGLFPRVQDWNVYVQALTRETEDGAGPAPSPATDSHTE
ncbi:MAG: hypothetical protein P4M00_02485 [Azospirillaceae bacterium]|nr:hypothetical protein [Azospirillaceae bacterium]